MKESRFNVYIPLKDGSTLIYNTFSDSRLLADATVLEAIDRCGDPSGLSSEQQRNLDTLGELGVLLEDSTDENRQFEYWLQRLRYDTNTLDATILTTMACNMSCRYCFQQGASSLGSMQENTISLVCKWLLQRVKETRPHNLKITFFGGEPLLNLKAVCSISEDLFQGIRNTETNLNIHLITNGLLLNRAVVNKLEPLGLQGIKVTLDGDRETHDRMRPLKGDHAYNGTYETILDNLSDIRGIVPIFIGGNYDEASRNGIPALLDDLLNRGFLSEHFEKIAFKPINAFPDHENNSTHSIEACTFSQSNLGDVLWLVEEIESRGFPSFKRIGLGPCEAMREHSFAIAPNGDLYKCSQLVGRKEYSIGNIQDEMEDILFSHQNINSMVSAPWQQCHSCKFVPICRGGCRLAAISAGGDFDTIACEKDYFERVSTKLIQREYETTC